MHKTEILVIGRNEQIVETIVRLINYNPEWNATFCLADEDAIAVCNTQHFDLVLLGGGIDEQSEATLRKSIHALQPDLKIIQHYGGGSGLLNTEINIALG